MSAEQQSQGKIRIMSDTLASQVAAGEVVERPASVIKELVENSLDAGAKHVIVEIQRGGAAGMKVTDDGSGMSPADARMCLERHATSKLRESSDLATVMTMGFRGEAIPSVASVGKLRLVTRERGAGEGVELSVEGGELVAEKEAGCAEGTSMEVRELFYNIPARRKFLKAESTESAHIEHQVRLHALAFPQVRFTYKRDGRVVFDLPASDDVRVRIAALAGPGAMADLVEVRQMVTRGISVNGYVLKANHARSGRRHQFVFLNRRPIEDKVVSAAIREGFGSVVGKGLNPAAWLWIEMEARSVDINVHPAKREVRFHREHEVRMAVTEAISAALRPQPLQMQSEAESDTGKIVEKPAGETPRGVRAEDQLEVLLQRKREEKNPAHTSEDEPMEAEPEAAAPVEDAPERKGLSLRPPERHMPVQPDLVGTEVGRDPTGGHDFRVVGPLSDRYFVLEGSDGLVLLDPIPAHERVIYEQILESNEGHVVASQGLLVPLVLEVDDRDKDVVLRHALHFSNAGIDVSDFGAGTIQVTGVPGFLKDLDAKAMLLEFIDELAETGGILRRDMAFERFAAQLASVSARNRPFCSSAQAEQLMDALFRCDLPFCGADGRPSLIQLSLQELDRRFRRK